MIINDASNKAVQQTDPPGEVRVSVAGATTSILGDQSAGRGSGIGDRPEPLMAALPHLFSDLRRRLGRWVTGLSLPPANVLLFSAVLSGANHQRREA
jgi:hypothetical protein